ncbi:monofunctional biosynthetic peptidoglycan transglycosylase [Bisgaardia hudsonensis]|uniref:Biosynthetic peptidoglycan transglycosylase n=1 Tax=Bisgaardia hudsonensis TaxID=109472 RepID=A0A4R2N3A6_9PAST|nr:monofunctional biosynthetic peptidoglycan transglycosylase [Bisgaardia hudsonensis]QLB12844.1 monofunctional biosynthetic peptidoglycan transglycosylase [Bisgaardia hudsonensis]TCP14403.1 monofunctional biosynthetic peptidoglycan transglycosylase [Bisgaardia hudsonensis]
MSKRKTKKNKFSFILAKLRCGIIFVVLGFFTLTLLFRFFAIPFSSYMAQQKISHWITGETYPIKYKWVNLASISPYMQLAVIATEDQLFPEHNGFDWNAIESALKHNQKSKKTRGGSTISQQTAKNLYLWHGQSWLRKAIEVPVTLSLELLWNKKRILEVYLNIAEFGNGIFGVEAASQYYFKKSAKQLTQQESALLASVLPNPIIFKVNKPSAYVKRKQAWIMKQMNQLGKGYLEKLD